MELDVIGTRGLAKVRHLKVLKNFNKIGNHLETLAAAQAIAEISLLLVGENDPIPNMLKTVLIHIERIEQLGAESNCNVDCTLASSVQACVHLLALGGYGLPIQECFLSGSALQPPIGKWEWRCSLLPEEGFAIGSIAGAELELNPSELALLQRLLRPELPLRKDGKLMGPQMVWLKLLAVIQSWVRTHLKQKIKALEMLQEALIN